MLVSDLLTLIQKGINTAKASIDTYHNLVPPLASVTLSLQTETSVTGTGGVNLWFVKLGGSASKGSSSQMTLVLKPTPPGRSPVSNNPSLDQTIAQVLIGAAKGVYDAQMKPDSIPLQLDSLSADFMFTVNKKGDGGVEFKLLPIGGSADVGGSKTDTQKITVKFAKPQPAKPAAP